METPKYTKEQREYLLPDSLQETVDILSDIPVPAKTITEQRFVDEFLPILSGKVEGNLGPWLEYVGGPYSETIVVDANQKQLFVVPPLLATQETVMEGEEEHSLYAIHQTAEKKMKVHARSGIAMLEKGIMYFVGRTKDTEHLRNRWAEIFKRYGITDTISEGLSATSAVAEGGFEKAFDDDLDEL